MHKRLVAAATAAVFWCAPVSAASVLTFDGITGIPLFGSPAYGALARSEGGALIPDGSGGQALASHGDANLNLFFDYPIDLLSFDFAVLKPGPGNLNIRGEYNWGGGVSETIVYDPSNPFSSVSFGSEWTGLTSLFIVFQNADPLINYSEFKIDNLAYSDSAVPELSTWAMMLLGFCAIGLSLRLSRMPPLRGTAAITPISDRLLMCTAAPSKQR